MISHKDKNIYRILYFLSNIKEASGQEIADVLGLRQPEIAVAMQELLSQKWIDERREPHIGGKGAPKKIYKLRCPLQNIKGIIKMRIEDEAQNEIQNIFRVLNGVN
jgi:predicted transcriptional regulator